MIDIIILLSKKKGLLSIWSCSVLHLEVQVPHTTIQECIIEAFLLESSCLARGRCPRWEVQEIVKQASNRVNSLCLKRTYKAL